jgi:hypothetical protein
MSISLIFPITLALMAVEDSGVPGPTGGGSESDPLAAAKAEEAYWKQVEAVHKAKTAAIEAEIAQQKKIFSAPPGQTAITGASELKAGAAKAEGLLLVTRAADLAAEGIAKNVGEGFCDKKLRTDAKCTVLLLTQLPDLSMAPVEIYEFQKAHVKNLLDTAVKANDDAYDSALRFGDDGQAGGGGRSLFTGIGAATEFAAKLGSYFLTDYSFGEVTVTPPDRMMANAVAGALNRTRCCFYTADVLAAAQASDVIAELQALTTQYGTAIERSNRSKARAAQLAQTQPDAAARLTAAAGLADTAAAAYKTFADGLIAQPAQGDPLLTRILRVRAIRDKLAANPLILIISHQQAAAFYTKKNLWTFFGGPPLYTMGGVAVSYTLLDGSTRQTLAAGSVAKHGGYRSVRQVEKLFR